VARRAGEKHAASDTATNSIAIELSAVEVPFGLVCAVGQMMVNAFADCYGLPAGEGPQRL
jgi:hypothetical protein